MEIKMGECIKALINKQTYWGDINFDIPAGTHCVVCETYDYGDVLVETSEPLPFSLTLYKKGEYEKEI